MSDSLFRKGHFADFFKEAFGGKNSPLREPITVQLGNPATGDVFVPEDVRQYENQVWLSDVVGDFPLPDSDDTERDDSPGGLYLGFLPSGALPPGKRKFGTTVQAQWRDGRYVVLRETVAGANYNKGVPEQEHTAVKLADMDYGLLRPTDPPSGRVVVSDSIHPGATNWEQLVIKTSADLITTYAGALTLGQARAVKVETDPTDNTFTYTAGSAYSSTARDAETGAVDHTADFASYPVTIDGDMKLHGWVRLYYQQSAITEQDILNALDVGGGGGGGAAEWSATDTANTPAAPGDLIGHWDYETGDLRLRNGSDPAGWLGPYNLPSIGTGGGGIDAGVKLIWSDTAEEIATSSSWQIGPWTYRPWDTDGFYDPGMGVLETVEGGIYDIELKVDFNVGSGTPLATMATVMPHIDVTLDEDGNTGSYGRKLVVPAGVDDSTSFLLQAVTTVRGRIADAEEIQAWMDNDLGDSIFVQRAELTLYRIQSPAFGTP